MRCFLGDKEPGPRRLMPPVSSLRRDIGLVVHRDLQHNARVRAVIHSLAELVLRERSLIAGEGVLTPAPEPVTAAPRSAGAPRETRSRTA